MGQVELTVPSTAAVADTVPNTHPTAIWFFFWGEFAERCSYYGMRAILAMYLTSVLGFTTATATPIQSAFKMACYFLPLAGGYIADRWLGRYWTIVGFSVPYVLGHFILGIPNEIALAAALTLLACGSGVTKPNISTLLGQTYDARRPGKTLLRAAAFNWFYASINYGALLSTLAMPFLRSRYGYAVAFQFPAWLMLGALIVFALGKRHYALDTPVHKEKTPEERRQERRMLLRLCSIFALVVFYWVAYEHNDGLWIYFARDYMDLSIPWLNTKIAPDSLQFVDPLFVIILVPLFNWLFPKLDPKVRIFTTMRKIMAGFLLMALASGLMSIAGFLVQGHTEQRMKDKVDEKTQEKVLDPETQEPVQVEATVSTEKVSFAWLVVAYVVMTIGEVLLYGTILELAYAAAPPTMKGMVTAMFLVTIGMGNCINMAWGPMYGGSLADAASDRGPVLPGQYFGITALVVAVAAAAFYFVGKNFERGAAKDAAAA